MKRQDRYTPYIRRGNFREKSTSFRVAFRLAFYRDWSQRTGKPFYVLVQRGWPNLAIEVGRDKAAIIRRIIGARSRGGFPAWCLRIKKFGQMK
jgi:hypothetical protein